MPRSNNLVFIFGAGASKAEGAPTTNELLLESFRKLGTSQPVWHIKDFLKDFFYVDVDKGCNDRSRIPTFEELLTILDISIARQDDLSKRWNHNELNRLRNDLIYCIAKILDETLERSGELHKKFVESLFENSQRNNKNVAFISLNYDILLDNALIELYAKKDWDIDYGVEFRNFIEPVQRSHEERVKYMQTPGKWHRPRREKAIYLLKLHGSLNWLYCPNCNTLKITKKEKGVLRIWTEFETCEIDGSLQRPLIIPPTWQKVYENPHLVGIWQKATKVLGKADEVYFVGYSLPDSDVKLKYLFKKFLYRDNVSDRPKISVVLKNDKSKEIQWRYKRFFGEDTRIITEGFEKFSYDLSTYLGT